MPQNYVHFFWAGSYPPYEAIKNLTSWSKHLSTTEFIPILWVNESTYKTILKHEMKIYHSSKKIFQGEKFRWNNIYDNMKFSSPREELIKLKYFPTNYEEIIREDLMAFSKKGKQLSELLQYALPACWQKSIKSFIKVSHGAKSFFWRQRRGHDIGILKSINILVVNIEDYIKKEIKYAKETKKIYLAENLQYVLQISELIHHYKLMTRFKNQFVYMILYAFGGFYFDVDIEHTNVPFITSMDHIRPYFQTGRKFHSVSFFKMLTFINNYDVNSNADYSDVAFHFAINGYKYIDRQTTNLQISTKEKINPFFEEFKRKVDSVKKDKDDNYYIINSPHKRLEEQQLEKQITYMHKFSQNKNQAALEDFQPKDKKLSPMFCIERENLEEHLSQPLTDVIKNIIKSEDLRIYDHQSTDYVKLYKHFFSPLFKQRYACEPSTLWCKGYHDLGKKLNAALTLQSYYINKKNKNTYYEIDFDFLLKKTKELAIAILYMKGSFINKGYTYMDVCEIGRLFLQLNANFLPINEFFYTTLLTDKRLCYLMIHNIRSIGLTDVNEGEVKYLYNTISTNYTLANVGNLPSDRGGTVILCYPLDGCTSFAENFKFEFCRNAKNNTLSNTLEPLAVSSSVPLIGKKVWDFLRSSLVHLEKEKYKEYLKLIQLRKKYLKWKKLEKYKEDIQAIQQQYKIM